MIKKIYRTIRFLILATIWTAFILAFCRFFMRLMFKFDIMSAKQWRVIAEYWNHNGVIAGFYDFSFFLVLIVVFVVWFIGVRKVNKIEYAKLFMKPIVYLANRDMKKYENVDNHVVIKNISIGEKLTIEDVIKDRIKQEKSNVAKDADSLRKNISEKIIKRKEQ